MKKLFLCLIALMLVALCACAAKPSLPDDDNKNPWENPGKIDDEPKTDIEVDKTEKLILVATYTNNSRLTNPASTAATLDENKLAFVPLGTTAAQAGVKSNIIYYTTDAALGKFDDLAGLPVKVGIKDGKVVVIEPAGKMLQGHANDFTSVGSRYYCRGAEIFVDYDSLKKSAAQYAWSQQISGIWQAYSSEHFIFNGYCDEHYTLVDSDGDGIYDFFREKKIQNGLQINLEASVEGVGVTFTNCGFGSGEYSGWFNNGVLMPYVLCGELAGKTLKEIGDTYLNVRMVRNNANGKSQVGTVLAMCEIYPAVTVTGKLEAFAPTRWSTFSPNSMTARVDGTTYRWSDVISSNVNCDGPAGLYAGRQFSTETSIGKETTLVFDMAGNIVKAVTLEATDMQGMEFTTFETDKGTQAAAVIDVQAWWHSTVTTYEQLEKKIQMLHAMGIRRVYVVSCNPGFPTFSNTWCGFSSRTSFVSTVERFKALGFQSPDHAIAKICHDMNMECYAIYKPYEGGGMENVPYDSLFDEKFTPFDGFGGHTVQLDTFLTQNLLNGKDYRIVRRPDGANDNLEGTVDKITIDFITDSYTARGNLSRREELSNYGAVDASLVNTMADGNTYTNKNPHKSYAINVWVSPQNYHYSLYNGDYSYTYKTGTKVLYDHNGDPMFDGAEKKVVTLEITGLAIDEYFCAVSFENTNGMRTDPLSFMHVYSNGREIYTSLTDFVRRADFVHDGNPDDYVWGHEQTPVAYGGCLGIRLTGGKPVAVPTNINNSTLVERMKVIERFYLFGFSFNFEPYVGKISHNVGVICAGRGAEETFPGGHCEAYPEVREFWLSHVQELIDADFDGVVIRLQGHSSIATDFKNYGYNEPIIEKYKELYGQAAYNTLMDPSHHVTDEEYIRIMRIRGDFFMLFADEASKLCHDNGKEFSVMLREAYCDPEVDSSQDEATWWCMPKVVLDWKRVVELDDFIVIKDYIRSTGEVLVNAKEIRTYAHSLGKKVWIQCYDGQAGMFQQLFFMNADKDPTIDGVMLYELTNVEKYYEQNLGNTLRQWGFKLK